MHTFDIRTDFLGIDDSKQTWDVDDFWEKQQTNKQEVPNILFLTLRMLSWFGLLNSPKPDSLKILERRKVGLTSLEIYCESGI